MWRGTDKFFSLVLVLWLAGCASNSIIPEPLEQQVDRGVTYDQIRDSPDSYRGKVVLWAGEVLKAKAVQGGTQLEILQLPLDGGEGPVTDRMESKGRFLAWQSEFLDPATMIDGTRVTIVGEVTGATVGKMDEADYRYPTVHVKHLHLWERPSADGPRAAGPWYGIFGGVGFGIGGGSSGGGGISIGTGF
ncbi:MAG TPA: Slp family lipoprotein [Nitrospira sp.]|jgi:outer membrane lipoprotein|nr:Slp family lipoprotein [Nitrospira sp.]